MRKFTFLLAFLCFLGMQVSAQQQISGTVSNAEDGTSIPGASVVVKGTTVGTVTDIDGNYTLTVTPDDEFLVFSFVGMQTQEVLIAGNSVINVALEPVSTAIEGVVVTALGISREKKSLGYAVQDLGGDDLSEAPENNLVNALTGKVSGVQVTNSTGAVGSSSRIVIRGNTSFNNNDPLFVVDGVPILNRSSEVSQWGSVDFGNAAMDIDPANIESVSILKGANAAALYGSRAANGVILITTKKGSKPGQGRGISVDFTTSFTMDNVYILPNYQNEYGQGFNGSEYVAKQNGVDVSNLSAYETWSRENSFSYYNGNWGGVNDGIDESWGPRLDAGLNIPQFNSPLDANGNPTATPWVSNPDNIKNFFETGTSWNNNLSITGGNDIASFRLGLTNSQQNGAVPNTDLTRNNVSFAGQLKASKRLTASVSANYIRNVSDNLPGNGYDENNIMQSLGGWFGRQVSMIDLKNNWETFDQFGEPYNWNRSYHNNPYWTVYKNTTSRTRDRVFGNVNLTYQITDWLKVMGRVGTDFYNEYRKHVVADMSIESTNGGSFWQRNMSENETNADLIFYADKNINEDLEVHATFGGNYMNRKYKMMYMEASELTVPDLYTISNVRGNASVAQTDEEKETNSLFGSASFGWRHMLYLDLTARNDWSSTLPSNNWSYFYPSASVSYIFTEMMDIDPATLSFGKVRASWAKVGNDTDPYQLYPTFVASADPFNGVAQYFVKRALPNADLKPETTKSMELGLDMKFFNNRLGFDFTYYNMNTSDQIMDIDISSASGYNTKFINAGEISNKGIEIMLSGKILDNPTGLNWEMTINWAKNKNVVEELYTDPVSGQKIEAFQLGSSWGAVTVEAREGEEFGVIKGGGYVYDDQGRLLVNPNTGLPEHSSEPVTIGNVMPDWNGGIRNTLSYKDVSLSFLIDARWGGDIFSVTDWFGAYAGVTQETVDGGIRENGMVVGKDVLDDQTVGYVNENGDFVENDIVVAPQDYFSDYWGLHEPSIIKGSFIKLREVVISYNLPKKWMKKTGFIKRANFSLIGRNLALLYTDESNDVGIDPETGFGTTINGMGLEQFQIPPTRSFGFKLQLSF